MRYYFEKPRPRRATPPIIIKRILVRCPATSRLTETGQTINEQLWAAAKLKASKLTCPHCRQVHNWTKKDVVLAR
jgi:hypothetical protein